MIKNFPLKLIFLIISFTSCSFHAENKGTEAEKTNLVQQNFPAYNYSEKNSLPSSGALNLPEDGVGLPDGRIIVADNDDGLHVLLRNGSTEPFGNMKEAGYEDGGARGVFLENDGKHILVACINSGEIYRVNIENETSKIIYTHQYGVNNIYKDKERNIWFTQSGENPNGTTKALDEAFAYPIPTGALFRLQQNEDLNSYNAKMMADSLYFANGITMDESERHVLVAEFRMDRILRFEVNKDTVINKEQYSIILSPDNIERGPEGNFWVASLLQNKIFAINKNDKSRHEIFSAKSKMNDLKQKEWVRKTHLGKSVIDIGHPDMWNPLTGPLTGVFWSYDQRDIYFTGLGSKILRYSFRDAIN